MRSIDGGHLTDELPSVVAARRSCYGRTREEQCTIAAIAIVVCRSMGASHATRALALLGGRPHLL